MMVKMGAFHFPCFFIFSKEAGLNAGWEKPHCVFVYHGANEEQKSEKSSTKQSILHLGAPGEQVLLSLCLDTVTRSPW